MPAHWDWAAGNSARRNKWSEHEGKHWDIVDCCVEGPTRA